MQLVHPQVEVIDTIDGSAILRKLERIGRLCYKSDSANTDETAQAFVKRRAIESGHASMLEHVSISVRILTDRGISHQIVRHRQTHLDDDMVRDFEYNPGVTQQSTRYCNYSKDKFGGNVTFIIPSGLPIASGVYHDMGSALEAIAGHTTAFKAAHVTLLRSMLDAENQYLQMLQQGASTDDARALLPSITATELILTCNLREWRSLLALRVDAHAHKHFRQIAAPLLRIFQDSIPVVFDDIKP